MARESVAFTLLCYWNGRITNGSQGIAYEGASPRPIRINDGISYNELLEKMYLMTGYNKEEVFLKIICRYPAVRYATTTDYVSVPVDNDESLDMMLDVARRPDANCLEIYLERVPCASVVMASQQADINGLRPDPGPVDASAFQARLLDRSTATCDGQTSMRMTEQKVDTNSLSLDPGPIDVSVLQLQPYHRSEAIWEGEDPSILTCRQRMGIMMRDWPLDSRLLPYIVQCGFYGVYRVGFIQLDWPLVTALVERWRQETHTFHLAVGESTITLQDVAVLFGLRIDGYPVTGTTNMQWADLCEELLGLRPDNAALQGSGLKLSWLRKHFRTPPEDADSLTLQRYARAFILALMGGVLFVDKSGSDVQLIFLPLLRDFELASQVSWGSAILALLYRELCRGSKRGAGEIAGPLVLLQLWAWERLHIGRQKLPHAIDEVEPDGDEPQLANGNAEAVGQASAVERDAQQQVPQDPLGCRWKSPHSRCENNRRGLRFYREQLDLQRDDQMIWQPYSLEILAKFPDQHIWRTVAPLICFDIVEWHRPDRALRQFGIHQGIPCACDTSQSLHAIDRRGRHQQDWKFYHAEYIKLWMAREENIAGGPQEEQAMQFYDPYMVWYRSITRHLITPLNDSSRMQYQPTAGAIHVLVQSLTNIHQECSSAIADIDSDVARQSLTNIQTMCAQALRMVDEERRLEAVKEPTPVQVSARNSSVRSPGKGHGRAAIAVSASHQRGRGRGRPKGMGTGLAPPMEASSVNVSLALPPHSHEANPIDGLSQSSKKMLRYATSPSKKKKKARLQKS